MSKKQVAITAAPSVEQNPFLDLLSGTSDVVGEAFFSHFAKHLARTYDAQFALVTELMPGDATSVRTLAFYAHDQPMQNFEYELKDTPCGCVYDEGLCYFKTDLQTHFPKDTDLVEMGVNSYLGIPLLNKHGEKFGHICVLGAKPVGEGTHATDYLKIFSSRAAAELERIQLERELNHHRDELITMVDEQTAELRYAKDLAEKANRAKTEFLARMSHELKTPLNAIYGFSQLMQEETAGKLNPVYKGYVQDTLSASRHLKNIINDLLDFSIIEIGKLKITIGSCPLKNSIDECIQMVINRANHHQIQIKFADKADTQLAVLADNSRLKEIIINLLTNAIKYNQESGQIHIDIQNADNKYVRVSVIDTGPGISKVEQSRVFNEFERLGADQDCIEGTGIGLALTKRLVEHMDGRIGLQSKLGQGSTFWFELPVAQN